MNFLEYLHEPSRLWLTWQRPDDAFPRTRRVVAEIVRSDDACTLRYLQSSEDYQVAAQQGFQGFPAFDPAQAEHTRGVMEALSRRLPPRKREDFDDYLAQFRLPPGFGGSDFALLGYTGARLPSDTFGFVPDFADVSRPIDLLLEVAGFRHQECQGRFAPTTGLPVTFSVDANNPVDREAVQVRSGEWGLGYVNRALLPWFAERLRHGEVAFAHIERINGEPDRPLIYVFCRVR